MSLQGVQVHLVDSVDTASELMCWLSTKDRIAIDTETTGLSKDRDHVRLVQVGDTQTGWAIPWERWGGVVEELVKKYTGQYVTHNNTYDVAMLDKEGVHVPKHKVDDTRLQTHVLKSTGSLALKKISRQLIDANADAGQEQLDEAMKKYGWTWATIPVDFQPYWVYGALDTILTSRIDEIQRPEVMREAPESYDLELAVSWVCEKMERRGALVDREYVQSFSDELTEYSLGVEKWCMENYGIKPGSDVDVIAALQKDGVDLVKRTASGARYSVDKEVLAELSHPLAKAVLGRRQAVKMVSTYLGNYLKMSEWDGFIHPSINTVGGTDKNPFEPGGGKGVRTGRMSMSDPNLQNVPIRTAAGARIRNAFIARMGHTWIKTDADQIEMRILAHVAQEEGMIKAFSGEGDFFVNLARELFADPNFVKADPRRQLVKNGGYAKIYGAGIPKFSKTAGVPEDEGRAFMNRFDTLFPGVRQLQNNVERVAMQRFQEEGEAYVRSPLTNRKHVADKGKEYALLNYLIQGTAGEVLKMKIVEADNAGLGDYMLFPVHDEIDMDVPHDEVDDVLTTLDDVMNDDKLLTVPITWSSAVGKRWGDVKDV